LPYYLISNGLILNNKSNICSFVIVVKLLPILFILIIIIPLLVLTAPKSQLRYAPQRLAAKRYKQTVATKKRF